ncbi:hypothetical protein PF008_g26788 [Phytophthora fragariae]|uniref:Secreted protein n=1 Tax=Phytophthora fragariae TaxID=53985 RepID=A0A6G0QGR5_9STRA|nr:hypothetical protein PF008_g26788 [Phytophthora fragariae]
MSTITQRLIRVLLLARSVAAGCLRSRVARYLRRRSQRRAFQRTDTLLGVCFSTAGVWGCNPQNTFDRALWTFYAYCVMFGCSSVRTPHNFSHILVAGNKP